MILQVNFWLSSGCRPLMILRFLGTSPDSSSVVQLLSSICRQICFYYRRTGDYDSPSDLNGLISRFKTLLSLATKSKPLILFLDSLDQLSSSDAARQLSWFPVCLPRHCKLVVSVVVQNYFGTLDRLRHILETPSGYLHILPVGPDLALSILRYSLANTNRTVSTEQWKIVEEAIGHCSIPLYIRMVFGEITRWRSYHRGQSTTLASGIRSGIIKIFERIENQHGKTLVSHAFGYVTLSKSGLTETELEDLLSLDEKVNRSTQTKRIVFV